eukprot:s6527_g1.t1
MNRERLHVRVEDMEIDTEVDPAPAGGAGEGQVDMDVGDRDRTKREADQSVEDLEAEMEAERSEARASGQPMTLDLLLMDDACHSIGSVLTSIEEGPEKCLVTGPGLFDDELNSIKFIPDRGPVKAARPSTDAEVPENTTGRMDESAKRPRDPEDEDDDAGFEYIPADVSPPLGPVIAKWILTHYASKISATPKSQAPDLAAFLKKMRVDTFLGATSTYRRELMYVDKCFGGR